MSWHAAFLTSSQEGAGSAVSVVLKVQWVQQGKQRYCSAAALSTKRSHSQNGPSRKEIIVIQYYYTFTHDWSILNLIFDLWVKSSIICKAVSFICVLIAQYLLFSSLYLRDLKMTFYNAKSQ